VTCEDWPVKYPCDVSGVDPTLLGLARESAQNLLWSLSGRRYGVCQTTESYRLPCIDPCLPPAWDRFGPGVEYALGWDNRDPCCRLPLAQTPVRAIISVVEKGVTLTADDYALERDVLWRNGQCWECDDDCDDPPVVVTYDWGIDVPPLGELAMGELTCEFLAAFEGRDCQLPSNAVSITRQGVTVDLGDVETLYRMGRIGLPISDAFLRSTNPNRLVSASKVYSPDLGRRVR